MKFYRMQNWHWLVVVNVKSGIFLFKNISSNTENEIFVLYQVWIWELCIRILVMWQYTCKKRTVICETLQKLTNHFKF